MRQYKMKETQEVSLVICNQCGREIPVLNGRTEEGVFSVDYTWGYFSNKDGDKHSFDLCEECYDKLVAGFKIPL